MEHSSITLTRHETFKVEGHAMNGTSSQQQVSKEESMIIKLEHHKHSHVTQSQFLSISERMEHSPLPYVMH